MTLTINKLQSLSSQANQDEIIRFSTEIENIVYDKDVSYMDAVILYCEQTGFEVETAAKLISTALKSKIQYEAEELNLIVKSGTNKLPI